MASETLALRTRQGSEIKSVLTERLRCLSPARPSFHCSPFPAVPWDRNSNSAQQTSCDSLLESDSISSFANESLFPNQQNLPSPGHGSYLSDESVNVNMTRQNAHCISDSCLVTSIGEKCASLDDNHVNTQRLMEFKVDNKPVDGIDEIKSNSTAQDDYQMIPPPIPVRKSKPGLPVKPEKTGQIRNCASSLDRAAPLEKHKSQSDPGQGGIILRSRSFQIVEEHPLNLINKKRQRYKSDTSLMARKTITEYVQPICVDSQTIENCGQAEQLLLQSSNDDCLRENKPTSPVDTEGIDCETTATETNDDASGNDKIHYVNLPVGSRPSCYLYMNLPDLGSAPKEQARNVKHVFISRNMKVIYENVFENDLLSVDKQEELPPLPPPILQPRKPPPRIPERMNRRKSQQRQLVQLSKTELTPPPRPPKKQKVSKSSL